MELSKKKTVCLKKTSLMCTLKYVSDILQTEKAFTVEEYKHTHTYTHTHTDTHTHTPAANITNYPCKI